MTAAMRVEDGKIIFSGPLEVKKRRRRLGEGDHGGAIAARTRRCRSTFRIAAPSTPPERRLLLAMERGHTGEVEVTGADAKVTALIEQMRAVIPKEPTDKEERLALREAAEAARSPGFAKKFHDSCDVFWRNRGGADGAAG